VAPPDESVKTQVIVLNGSSSSGKTAIARCLKAILPTPWISLSIDDLLDALPPSLMNSDAGVAFGEHGEVTAGEGFRAIALPWMSGIAAMARAGARIIYDDVFLAGAESQERLRAQLDGLNVLWVGVHCDAKVAAGREIARGDRVAGGAASQATRVHEAVFYDLEVDTTSTESLECARIIAGQVS
jgi:chloramphenicol 3-O phosphotransferase